MKTCNLRYLEGDWETWLPLNYYKVHKLIIIYKEIVQTEDTTKYSPLILSFSLYVTQYEVKSSNQFACTEFYICFLENYNLIEI